MGPIDRREREKLALRARIMKTARRLFAEKGYEAVTMRMIADTIEYSPRTIYLHFEDKEDLFWQLCMEDYEAFGKGLAQVLEIADPIDRLKQMGRSYAEFGKTHPHHYRLMFMTRQPKREHEKDINWKGNPEQDSFAMLMSCVQEAMKQGRFRKELQDPNLVAQIVWAAVHGIVSLELTHCDEDFIPWLPFEQRVDAAIDMIYAGILKDAPKPAKPAARRR
jgi:AcrR family transcriptional regulator